jgi:hypothetical protein
MIELLSTRDNHKFTTLGLNMKWKTSYITRAKERQLIIYYQFALSHIVNPQGLENSVNY